MNPFAFSCLLVFITTLPLGYFVYAQNRKQLTNKIWLVYSLALCFWGFFGMLIGMTGNANMALIYWRVAMGCGIIWMPVLFYHFAYLYAPWGDHEKKKLIGAYVITTIFAVSAFTPFYIPYLTWMFNSFYWARPGVMAYLLALWWVGLTLYTHTKLYFDSKTMPKERQNQIKYFLVASVIGYLGGFYDFGVIFGFTFYPWLNFSIVLYPFIMTYAIIKHGLFDIFIFIKRLFYSAIGVGILAWIIGSVGVINGFLQSRFHLPFWTIPILAAMISVYVIYLFVFNARKGDRAKEEFITIAAHKLRTPLTHIHYIADGLKTAKTKEETDSLVANLGESTDLLISLVNKVLEVTNLETQSEKYEFTSVDLKAMTDEAVKNSHMVMEHKKIIFTFDVEPDVPKVEGYEKSLKFVIQSLLENAVKYTPEGGKISVSISFDKKNITWSISDSGIGIAEDDLDKIFDKFFRGQNALTTDTEGTGLAMYISRNLIKRQGGTMKVESAGLGQGATFWFTLPLR